jgi:hypothetical protein
VRSAVSSTGKPSRIGLDDRGVINRLRVKWTRLPKVGICGENYRGTTTHGVPTAVDVTLLGRYYERFADHAVEIARRVIYQATGATDIPDQTPRRPPLAGETGQERVGATSKTCFNRGLLPRKF